MPKKELINRELVLSLYAETKSGREVARRMGIHETTVYAILKRHRSLCIACGKTVTYGHTHCDPCRAKIREDMREKRKRRRRQGLCDECDQPIQPPSNQYCAHHRIVVAERNVAYRQRQKEKRGSHHDGVANQQQREYAIRNKYGEDAVLAWQRDQGTCIVCGVPHAKKTVHLHHIDGDDQHSTVENLACLCFRCHKLTHLLVEHPDPEVFMSWVRSVYPTLSFSSVVAAARTPE
jgi:hypothetical protein